jgi:hypothetical protein
MYIETIKFKPVRLFLRFNAITSLKFIRKYLIPMVQLGVNELLFLIIICLRHLARYFSRELIKIAVTCTDSCDGIM